MPKESLELDYYTDKNGTQNEIIKNLGNCFTKNMFFILKNYVDNVETLYKAYIDDFTFHISRDSKGVISSIDINDIINFEIYVEMCNKISVKQNGVKAMEELEHLLDNNEIVFINTFMRKVPYYKTYVEALSEDDNTLVDRHIFLALWHTKDTLYYLDNVVNRNPKFFVPYEKNNDIGVAKKSEFLNAFTHQFNCCTIKPNLKELKIIDENLTIVLKETIRNYHKSVKAEFNGNNTFCGRNSILELENICKEERFYMNESVSTYVTDLFSRIDIVFSRSCSRKKVFLNYLTVTKNVNARSVSKIIDAINNSITKMQNAKNFMYKNYVMSDYLVNSKFIGVFEEVLFAEDVLYSLLEENLYEILYLE